MVRSFRKSPALRVVAVLFLVPVVVFSNATQATAAATGSFHAVQIEFDADPTPGMGGVDCWFQLAQEESQLTLAIGEGGRCISDLTDYSPGWSQAWEAGARYHIEATGSTPTGAVCGGATAGTFGSHPSNGFSRVAGSIPPGVGENGVLLSNAGNGGCAIQEVCVWSEGTGGGADKRGCVDVTIPIVPSSSTCPYGTPSMVRLQGELYKHNDRSDTFRSYVRVSGVDGPKARFEFPQPHASGTAYRGWHFALVGSYGDASANNGYRLGYAGVDVQDLQLDTTDKRLQRWYTTTVGVPLGHPHAPNVGSFYTPIPPGGGGWQIYYLDPNAPETAINGTPNASNITTSSSTTPATTLPTAVNQNFGGLSIPSRCIFYFGSKVSDIPNTTADEPWGEPKEDTHEPPPVPPVDDPTPDPGDGFNWLSAIWSVLNLILSAIKAVAAALVNMALTIAEAVAEALREVFSTLLDGIAALFIPEDGFFEDELDKVQDSAEGTTLGNYVDALSGMAPSGGSGCSGPTIQFPALLGGASGEPLSACSGAMATAADFSRVIIGVSVGLSGFFAVVRILGRSLGWDPGLGGGDPA